MKVITDNKLQVSGHTSTKLTGSYKLGSPSFQK